MQNRRRLFIISFVLISSHLFSQDDYRQIALQLLNNEKDFVITSQLHGLPYGFMQYSTDSSMGLNQKGISRIRDDWQQQKKTNYSMVWKPVVVYAGEDSLHGVTSGPYYIKGEKDSVFRKGGYFLSVWERKSIYDSFRLVSDCGIRFPGDVALDDKLTELNARRPGSAFQRPPKHFNDFTSMAASSLSKAMKRYANPNNELLLSGYGMFVGDDTYAKVPEQGASLLVEKEIDLKSLKIVVGRISFATNPFPDDKKLQKEGWFFQVWSYDEMVGGLIATLLRF
jgi:hypothetical protein